MRAKIRLDHVEAAQGSSLHGMDDPASYAFKCHAVDESSPHCGKLTVESFYMLLGVYLYSLLPATSVDSWLHYTLSKLDTSSNRIYTVKNPQVGYVTTSLCSVVTTTALGFLNLGLGI